MPVGDRRPLHVIGGHVGDRASAGEHRLGITEHRRGPDQHAATEWRVHLVAGERQEVDPHRDHIDRPVRRQLSGVDREQRAVLVGQTPDLGDREDLPGHVARAGDGDDPDRADGGPRAHDAASASSCSGESGASSSSTRARRRQGSMFA